MSLHNNAGTGTDTCNPHRTALVWYFPHINQTGNNTPALAVHVMLRFFDTILPQSFLCWKWKFYCTRTTAIKNVTQSWDPDWCWVVLLAIGPFLLRSLPTCRISVATGTSQVGRMGSIPGQAKLKTLKLHLQSFLPHVRPLWMVEDKACGWPTEVATWLKMYTQCSFSVIKISENEKMTDIFKLYRTMIKMSQWKKNPWCHRPIAATVS